MLDQSLEFIISLNVWIKTACGLSLLGVVMWSFNIFRVREGIMLIRKKIKTEEAKRIGYETKTEIYKEKERERKLINTRAPIILSEMQEHQNGLNYEAQEDGWSRRDVSDEYWREFLKDEHPVTIEEAIKLFKKDKEEDGFW